MAWSRSPVGPFTLYNANAPVGERGVLDNNNREIRLDEGIQIRENHIASPDVHVDDDAREIIMYFHSGSPYRFNGRDIRDQVTWVNTSDDGLSFRRSDTRPVILGESYMRVFEYDRTLYAFDNSGGPRRAPSFNNPWEPPRNYYNGNTLSNLWERRRANLFRDAIPEADRRVRHSGIRVSGNNAQIFYSIRGDSPERLFVSNMNLNTHSWNEWTSRIPGTEILRAVAGWEGGEIRPRASTGGAATGVNQLRDPYPFEDDDGSLYLYYSGQGEEAIGVAALQSRRQRISTSSPTDDAYTSQGSSRNNNTGRDDRMRVRNGGGSNDRRAFLRFRGVGGGTVEAAVLRIYIEDNESGNLDIYAADSFRERNITGNNQPDQTGRRIDRLPLGQRGFYEFDVTEHVNNNRNRDFQFVIRTSSRSNVSIRSSENSNTNRRPQLKWLQRR